MGKMMRCKDCWNQQPLPSRLQVAHSQMGRECSPASSGVSVTVPSSSTKQGIPAAPYRLASSNTGLLSRSFKNALRFFYMLSDVDDFIVVVSFYLFFYIRAVGARFHSVYLNHDEGFLIALLAKVGKKSLYGRVFFLNFGEKRRFPCL